MNRLDINKYWIGYLTGILVLANIFSVGVILSYTLSLNWVYFFWIWIITLPILKFIFYLKRKQEKEIEKNNEKNL